MKIVAMATLLLLLPLYAFAFTLTPTNAVVTVTVQEPSTNTDGSPLSDLSQIKIYWKLGTGVESSYTSPATSQAGGQPNVSILQVPYPTCQSPGGQTLIVQATAVNLAAAESARSAIATLALPDRTQEPNCIGPGTPQVGKPTLGPTVATFPITWAASMSPYTWSAGCNNGTNAQSGTAQTNSLSLSLPYTCSAQGGFVCIRDANGNPPGGAGACQTIVVPHSPTAPPTVSAQ